MHDVFISYSNKNKNVADAVVNILETRRIKCWIAPRDEDPGEDFATSISCAIKNCKVCVFVLSNESNQSKHVLNEIYLCFNNSKTIIPFRIDDVSMQDPLPYYIGRTHWLDALTDPLEEHINNLADTLDNLLKNETVGHTNINNKIREKTSAEIEAVGNFEKSVQSDKTVELPIQIDLSDSGVFHNPSTAETCRSLRVVDATENEVSIKIDFTNQKTMFAGFYIKLYGESWQNYHREECSLIFQIVGDASDVELALEVKGKDKNIIKTIPVTVSGECCEHKMPLSRITKRIEAFAEMTELVFLFTSGCGTVRVSDMGIDKS